MKDANNSMNNLLNYIFSNYETMLLISVISMFSFVMSILCIPLIIRRLPYDFFMLKNITFFPHLPILLRFLIFFIKNAVGILLLAAGIIMLFIPGQGILTIIMGLALMDFPGKRNVEIKLLRLHSVQKTLNWLRKNKDLKTFKFP